MLNQKGFDLWADGYDRSVGMSEESNSYPFAGYKKVLNRIYGEVLTKKEPEVLDIGFGTGTLTSRLYEQGCHITGVDFSQRMIELAQEKMPDAELLQGDFTKGLPEKLVQKKYDFIIATYSMHHLTDEQKAELIGALLPTLEEGGKILIGDVAFQTRRELEKCREECGSSWDSDEIYFVFEELKKRLCASVTFERMSFCAGVFVIERNGL